MTRAIDLLPVFWLTRDTLEGVLSPTVEVWAVRPERNISHDGDAIWLAPIEYLLGERDGATHVDDLTLGEAYLLARNGVPENDRECTRVGR